MLFGIQMCILSFPMLCMCCLLYSWINKCGQVWRHLVLLFHCWHWGGASSKETNPLLCDTCAVTKGPQQSQQQICFSLQFWLACKWAIHSPFQFQITLEAPTKRLCGCTVLFKSRIPRQVQQDGKLILTWQTQAGTNVLSLILLCAGSLFQSFPGWQKVNTQEIWDSWWCFMPCSYNCRKHLIHFIPAKWNLDTQLRKMPPMGFPVAPIAGFTFCYYEEIVQRIYRFRSYNGELLALWIILLFFLYLYHMLNKAVKFGCDFYCFTVLRHS